MNLDLGQTTSCGGADFYVVIKEQGHKDPDLPVWTCTEPGSIRYHERPAAVVERKDLSEITGAFHLLNVLSDEECDRFVQISEALGYHGDAPVSLPRSIRHNNNLNWIVDKCGRPDLGSLSKFLWSFRIRWSTSVGPQCRFRFYRYPTFPIYHPNSLEIVPLPRGIPYAAIRWHDFGNRPALGRPLGHFSRHPDTPLLSLSPRRRFPRPTPERVFRSHQSQDFPEHRHRHLISVT